MTSFQHIFLFSFALCLVLIPISSILARHVGLIDNPGGRKTHDHPTPTIGGLTILISLAVSALLFFDVEIWLIISLFLLGAVGAYDDSLGMSAPVKLVLQTAICLCLIYFGDISVRSLGTLPGETELYLGAWGPVFTVLAMVGLINAINMIDGIDGLAGLLSISILINLVLAIQAVGVPTLERYIFLITAIIGSTAGFLVFNFMPGRRKVFLGDAGSMVLGLILAYLLITFSQASPQAGTMSTSLTAWLVALPVIETLTLFIRRLRAGRSPFSSDREHLHHLLMNLGISRAFTLLIILIFSNTLFWLGMILAEQSGLLAGLLFLTLPFVYTLTIIHPLKRYAVKNRAVRH